MKTISILTLTLALATNGAHAAPAAAAAPATISKEGDLTTIILKPEAEQRLRLKVVPVERRAIPATRLFSGEVVRSLGAAGGGVAPVVGGTLDELLRLTEVQVTADGRVLQAQVQLDAAKVARERAEKMLKAEAGSARSVDEAKAAVALAEAAATTAKAQREVLGTAVGQSDGANRAWVRVAIYSGEAALLNAQAAAAVRALTAQAGESAKPVAGPPTANAAANTVDWYYELPTGSTLRLGERMAIEILTRESKTESLVVPFNAVLHDIHGGQWVYVQTAEHTYTRRRVQVARLADGIAVLASGPPVGSKVVTDGAAELFGTEFMTGK